MDISVTPALERIARVLAAQRLSANAEGAEPSAAQAWHAHLDDATAVLKTLREPDEDMVAAYDEIAGRLAITLAWSSAISLMCSPGCSAPRTATLWDG